MGFAISLNDGGGRGAGGGVLEDFFQEKKLKKNEVNS